MRLPFPDLFGRFCRSLEKVEDPVTLGPLKSPVFLHTLVVSPPPLLLFFFWFRRIFFLLASFFNLSSSLSWETKVHAPPSQCPSFDVFLSLRSKIRLQARLFCFLFTVEIEICLFCYEAGIFFKDSFFFSLSNGFTSPPNCQVESHLNSCLRTQNVDQYIDRLHLLSSLAKPGLGWCLIPGRRFPPYGSFFSFPLTQYQFFQVGRSFGILFFQNTPGFQYFLSGDIQILLTLL